MKTKKACWIVCAGLLLYACHESPHTQTIVWEGFDEEMRANGEGLAVDSFFAIPLQTDRRCLVESVKKIVPAGSLLVLVSEKDVLAFNRQGQFVCRFGHQGNGEGEYNRVSTAYWDEQTQTLNIVDGTRERILTFGADGRLLDTNYFRPGTFSLLNTAESLGGQRLFCSHYIYNDQNMAMSDFNLTDNTQDTVYRFPGQTDNTQEYTGRHPFATYKGRVTCVLPFDQHLYTYSPEERRLHPIMEVGTQQPLLTETQLEEMDDYGINRYAEEWMQGTFVGFTDVFETDGIYLLGFSNLYYAVANKATGRIARYTYHVDKENITSLPLLNISATDENGFLIGYEDAFEMKDWHFADSASGSLRAMQQAVSTLSDTDNPCLFFYKLGH